MKMKPTCRGALQALVFLGGTLGRPTPKKPTDEEARAFFEIYEQIYKMKFSLQKKKEIMTHVLGHEPWSFRVTGISKKACIEVAANNFYGPKRKLERGHKRPRAETYRKVFEKKFEFEEWWKFVWEGDATILVTKEENKPGAECDDFIDLNWEDGYFADAHIGWRHSKKFEGEKVREICERYNLLD
jgi:hypothetical protein